MALLQFRPRDTARDTAGPVNAEVETFLNGFSIEVMPRTAAKVDDFRALLPKGTRVYVAHIEGTPIDDMIDTARGLSEAGFYVMPHFPARIIKDRDTLATWIKRYADEAGVSQALLLAGGVTKPHGDFSDSMQLLETGLFDAAGFTRLHIAGHPEGNRDIDPDGGDANVMAALKWKQDFASRTDADMAIATQFAFEAAPVIEWAETLAENGVTLPVHIGIAGPAKLQTLIKFAIACGVGPSLKLLQKRARDVTKLVMPFEPTEIITDLAAYKAKTPQSLIETAHFFPLGGIKTNANWTQAHGGTSAAPASA